jgi:hypothetical protein
MANIPPTINALAFVDPVGKFSQVLELEFPIKNFEKFTVCHLLSIKG